MLRRFTFLFAFLALTKFIFPQAVWSLINPLPDGFNVTSLAVVDSNVVFVVGPGKDLWRTLDGGTTWEQKNAQIPNGAGNFCVSAVDSLNCVVGWLNSAGSSASIFRTTDGGKTWRSVVSLAKSFPDGIKMFSPSYGIFIGDPEGNGLPYQFRYTTDGGATWILSPTAPIANNEYGVTNAFDFIDTNRIWVGSANTDTSKSTAKIYRTTTGINGTWTYATVTGTQNKNGVYYQAIAFTDSLNGMAGSNGANIIKTTDGGTTWATVVNPSGLTNFAVLNMNGFKDGSNTIWMSVITGTSSYNLYTTTNLGTTWNSITKPDTLLASGMAQLQFFSPTLGYSGGLGGVMYKYSVPVTGITDKNYVPINYSVSQNYPNPFNPSTLIQYQVPENTFVSIKVYNSLGQEKATLVNGVVNAGTHNVEFNGSNLSSGIYFYVIRAGEKFVQTRKMVLLK